jgi:predicted extracellular nuclease
MYKHVLKKVSFALILLLSLIGLQAQAQTAIIGFDFDDSNVTADSGLPTNIPRTLGREAGAPAISFSAGATGQSASSTAWDSGNGTKYYVIDFTTTGYENITVESKQRSSGTGPSEFKVQYSLNNTTWTDVPATTITVGNNFTTGVLPTTTVPAAVNNQTVVYLRWIMTATNTVTNSGGTSRIDDIAVKGTPIPVVPTTIIGFDFDDSNVTADSGLPTNIPRTLGREAGAPAISFSAGATGQSASSTAWDSGNGTKYYVIDFTTTGYENITVESKQRSSGTGPSEFKVQYSLNNTTWTDVPATTITVGNNFTTGVLPTTTVPAAVNNQTVVYLRWIMTATNTVTNSGGTSRIDDIAVKGTPTATPTVAINVTGTLSAFTTTAVSVASAEQSYQVSGTLLTSPIVITAPSMFGVSLISGGPFTTSVSIPFATANAGNTPVYAQYLPTTGTSHTGNITHFSIGSTTVNLAVSGSIVTPLALTPIYSLQGAGTATPFVLGTAVATSGVVTADFQTDAQMRGFFIQDIIGDANVLTSDGIFVYVLPSDAAWVDVAVGDEVRVQGEITEFFTLTQINNVTSISILGVNALPTPVAITFPETVEGDLERYEGMYTTITNTMTVAQNYFWGRYGQLSLSAAGRSIQPTQRFLPGSAAYIAEVDRLKRNFIVLDDGSTAQNPNPLSYVGLNNTVRAGDEVTNLTGVIHYDRITPSSSEYVFHPNPTITPTFTRSNPRTVAPTSVGATANVKVASFNVLNYFITFGGSTRGADNALELQRQEDKLIPAILGLNADVIGLMEISNVDGALANLVTKLNTVSGAGTWATITHPFPGTDAIKVAIIYKPAVVTPSGAALSSTDAIFDRPPLAQAFTLVSNAEKFSVVVNHFKSKGGTGTGANADSGDGAGNFNLRRTQQATALRTLVTSVQATSSDNDVLVIGDLNAYAMEDPIRDFTDNGFVNLIDQYVGNANAYSFIFDSYSGYLDHALATSSLAAQSTGATEWRINGDEPFVIDYNTEFKFPNVPGSPDYWTPTPYRSSDHDPVIVGLNLQPLPLVTLLSPVDNSTSVAIATDLVLTFDINVQAGIGNITITDGVTPITFPIAGNAAATVTIVGNQVIINLTADLANATNYYVLIPAGTIQSTTGGNFAGFALATDWNFTTASIAPVGGGGSGTTPTLTRPTNFEAVAISTSQINLTWDALSGATGYILYRGNTVIATLGAVTSFQNTGLNSDTFYSYRLVATNGSRQSDPAQANARTFPAPPSLLSVTNACSGSVGIIKVSSTGSLYRFYTDDTSIAFLFETDNATITSPSITTTTTFYISLVSNGRESTRTPVIVVVNPLPIANLIEDRIISCEATSTITAEEVLGASYTWIINGSVIETTNIPTYLVNRSGNYQVRVNLNGCFTISDITSVRLSFVPIAQIIQGIVVRSCEPTTTISAIDAGTDAIYEWTRNNVVVGSTASVSVSESGTYTLRVIQNGCLATDEIAVEISTIDPNVSFSASQTTICLNEEVTLVVDAPQQGVIYTWVRNGRVINITGTEYVTSMAGEYRVRASQNSCTVFSAPIKVDRIGIEPVYLRKENYILSVESITSITDVVWLFEGEENTSFAGQMSITPEIAGNYSARVTFDTGCQGSTRTVYYSPKPPVVTGEEEIIDVETIVYPNPSKTGVFRIQLSNRVTSDVTFIITDNIGRVLENKTIKASEVSTLQTLDLSHYAQGMYALTIKTKQGTVIKKIIIE